MQKVIGIIVCTILFVQVRAQEPGSGNALEFDGLDDYVQINANAALDITDQLTMSAWVYLRDTISTQGVLTKYDSGPGLESYGLFVQAGGEFELFVASSGAPYTYIVSTGANIVPNVWHHLAGTYDSASGDIKIFLNGVEVPGNIVHNAGGASSIEVTSTPIMMGVSYEPPGHHIPLDGKIDEARIWNRALSQTEIQENMCRVLSGSEVNLMGYWRMDEGADNTCTSGADVCDATGNGNHGTKL